MRFSKAFVAAISLTTCMLPVTGVFGAATAANFNAPGDVKEINRIEEVLATETSMDKLIGYYAPDAMVLDIYAPGIFKGRDQIRAGFEPQFAMIKDMKHKISDINVATNGNFACAAMQLHFDTVLKDGKSVSVSIRQLDAFKKVGGKWQIVQQHISLPVDAATGMGLMNAPVKVRGPIAWTANAMPGPASTPEAGIAAIRNWMEVGAASTSLEQLMSYYGPGDDILVYDSFYPGEMRGMKEVSDYYAAMMNSYKGITVKLPELVVDSDGAFGVQIDTQDITLTMKDGSIKNIALRQSDCMRRVGDRWYSFMEMLSFPIDPATGKAIMESASNTAK